MGEDVEQPELFHSWWECKMVVTLEDSLVVSHRTKHFLKYDLAIVLLDIFNEIKTHIHTKT